MDVQAQLKSNGKVSWGRIGVGTQQVTKELSDSFGLQRPTGVLVASVEKDGPAGMAGIKSGDILININAKPIDGSDEFVRLVSALKPGNRAAIQLWRNGSMKDLSVVIGESPN